MLNSHIEDALVQARDWVAEGQYEERVRVSFSVCEILEDGSLGDPTGGEVWAGPSPDEPGCIESRAHAWCAPLWLGGDPENSGVFTVLRTTVLVCRQCGTYRQTVRATGPCDPEEAPEGVTYSVADRTSQDWDRANICA